MINSDFNQLLFYQIWLESSLIGRLDQIWFEIKQIWRFNQIRSNRIWSFLIWIHSELKFNQFCAEDLINFELNILNSLLKSVAIHLLVFILQIRSCRSISNRRASRHFWEVDFNFLVTDTSQIVMEIIAYYYILCHQQKSPHAPHPTMLTTPTYSSVSPLLSLSSGVSRVTPTLYLVGEAMFKHHLSLSAWNIASLMTLVVLMVVRVVSPLSLMLASRYHKRSRTYRSSYASWPWEDLHCPS